MLNIACLKIVEQVVDLMNSFAVLFSAEIDVIIDINKEHSNN